MTYKELRGPDGAVAMIEHPDGFAIPMDEMNRYYQEYLHWLAQGNTVEPADPAPIHYSEVGSLQDIRVRTTNAVATEIFRRPLAVNTGYRARMAVIGIDAGNGAMRHISATIIAKRLGGNAILVGTSTPESIAETGAAATTAGVASWTISASVSGVDFVVTVSGAAGRNIDWLLTGNVESFTPGGS